MLNDSLWPSITEKAQIIEAGPHTARNLLVDDESFYEVSKLPELTIPRGRLKRKDYTNMTLAELTFIAHSPPHYHRNTTEVIHVINGEGKAYLGGDIFRLYKGDWPEYVDMFSMIEQFGPRMTMIIPSGVPHATELKSPELVTRIVTRPVFDTSDEHPLKVRHIAGQENELLRNYMLF